MASKKTKIQIFIGVFVALIVLVGGIAFYVSKKISPEEIRKLALESMSKALPAANIELGGIDYSLGFSVNLQVSGLKMDLKDKKQKIPSELFTVKNIEVKIPVWALLIGSGEIVISVDNPRIYYFTSGDNQTNWKLALEGRPQDQSQEEKKPEDEASMKKKAEILGMFANSDINIKLTDVNVVYKKDDGTQGTINLSHILVKNLNLKSPTAFELASNFEFVNKKGEKSSLDALVIGDLNFQDVILKKDLKSSIVITLDHIKGPQIKQTLPQIKTDLNVVVSQSNGGINAKVNVDFNPLGNLRADISLLNGKTMVTGLNTNLSIKDLLATFSPDLELVDGKNSKFELKGNVEVNKGKINSDLDFNLSPALTIKSGPDLVLGTTAKGAFKGKNLAISINNQMMGGTIDTNIQTTVDLEHPPTEMSQLAPIKIDVNAANIQLAEDFLRKKMEASSQQAQDQAQAQSKSQSQNQDKPSSQRQTKVFQEKTLAENGQPHKDQAESSSNETAPTKEASFKPGPAPSFPTIVIQSKWSQIRIGRENFSGSAKIGVNGNKIASEDTKFSFSQGKGSIAYLVTLLENSAMKMNMDFQLSKLNLNSLKIFLPAKIDQVTGTFSGNVKGDLYKAPAENKMNYNFATNLEAVQGEVKGINLSEMVNLVLEKVPLLKNAIEKKDYKISNDFEQFLIDGQFQESKYDLKKFVFKGINKAIEITGQGNIYPTVTGTNTKSKESIIDLEYVDHTGVLSEQLEKRIGTRILPIRLKGPGFNLMPDYGYTIEKLAKVAADTYKNKLTEKAKKQIEKKVEEKVQEGIDKLKDKYLKGDEEKGKQIKNLIKGIFQ